ncbi:MAG: ABC-type branched-chain amino acid transport system periplasmic [Geobacteraceae bacterium]|nr:MAG: ABC-type branched-chain amino acid transport system periplasmic [Geobacteraceae bacterium]
MKQINFSALPLFKGLDRIEIAKLIPSLITEHVHAGADLFRQGDPGDSLLIIVKGKVSVFLETGIEGVRELATLGHGECFGEMALLTGAPRSATVRTLTDATLLRLPKENFDELLKKHHSLSVHFAGVLAGRLSSVNAVPGPDAVADEPGAYFHIDGDAVAKGKGAGLELLKNRKIITFILLVTLCSLSTLFMQHAGFSFSHIVLLELILAATIIWSFDIIPYHAVSIALPMFAVLFGISTTERAFSGFSRPYWFLALGVFALSAAIFRTGLLYRLALLIMLRFPGNYFGQTFALALAGFILTPLIPSAYGRSILASPIAVTMSETMRLKKDSPGTIGIAMACLLGFGHMSFMFMNGSATCAFVMGLIPGGGKAVSWGGWLEAALPLGISFFLMSYAAIILLYRPDKPTRLPPETVEAQLKALGPWTGKEKVALATVIASIAAFATEPLHHLNEAWIAMFGFLFVFATGTLEEKSIRSDMDWSFLIALGAMVGFGDVLAESGLVNLLVSAINPYLQLFSGSKTLFLMAFSLAVHLVRCALPLTPGLLVSMLAAIPVLSSIGIDPFVTGLVALASGNPWILKQQNSIYRNVWKATEGKLFHHEDTMKIALLHVAIVTAAVGISVPYWEHLGLIR